MNDWASVLWPSAAKRYVSWNGWRSGSASYRQYLRIGTGGFTVASVAATLWEPKPITGQPRPTVRIEEAGPTRADTR